MQRLPVMASILNLKLLLLCAIYAVYKVHSAELRSDPLVLIDQGLIRGQNHGNYSSFLGIPYAAVDPENVFGASLPHPGFGSDVFNAYNGSIACPQTMKRFAKNTAIDCLTLNIYSPHEASSSNPLPVSVDIHGGGFQGGSAGGMSKMTLVHQGIVVVLINYRLGPYGFMCLDSPLAPGNQGLKDQYQALQWIKNNINAFGGNPYNITIGGGSAGSMSVIYHLYSQKKKLFNKVIAQSGVPLTENYYYYNPEPKAAVILSNYLGFNTTNDQQALSFLSTKSHDLVIAASKDLNLSFFPCKEHSYDGIDSFITTDLNKISNEEVIKNTPILIGYDEIEAQLNNGLNLPHTTQGNLFYGMIKENLNMEEETVAKVSDIVKHYYIGDGKIEDNIPSVDQFLSDFAFLHPIQRTITTLMNQKAGPVYQYLFKYSKSGKTHHTEESVYLNNNSWDDEDDQLISDRIITMWANFVKYGNPTPETTELLPVKWTATVEGERPYLVIDKELKMESRYLKETMAFWDIIYYVYDK